MKFLFVIYIILTTLLGFIGVCNDEVDKEQKRKPAWAYMLSIIFLIISPIVAKLCGLI